MYDTADYAYTPAWLQTGDYEIDCIDGKLALFQTSDGERLAVYAEQPFLSWRTGSSGVYMFREQDILHCSYDGSSEETLYAAQDGTIISFAAAGDVLFFAEKTDNCIRLCRLCGQRQQREYHGKAEQQAQQLRHGSGCSLLHVRSNTFPFM